MSSRKVTPVLPAKNTRTSNNFTLDTSAKTITINDPDFGTLLLITNATKHLTFYDPLDSRTGAIRNGNVYTYSSDNIDSGDELIVQYASNNDERNSREFEVSRGNITGHTFIEKFGENPAVTGLDFIMVWDAAIAYVPPTTARIHDISSDLAADTGVTRSSGTATGGSATTIEDLGAAFVSDGGIVGDFVLNDSECLLGRVVSLTETIITVSRWAKPSDGMPGDPFESGETYRVVGTTLTGASIFFIFGQDLLRNDINEFVVLNGITPVPTVLEYSQQFRARVFGLPADGTVTSTAQVDGTITCQVINGNNQSLMAYYPVPAGHTGWLTGWWASMSKKTSGASTVVLRAGEKDSVGYIQQTRTISSTGKSDVDYTFKFPLPIVAGAAVWIESNNTGSGDIGVAGGFTLEIVKDGF